MRGYENMNIKTDKRVTSLKITEPVTTLLDEGQFLHILTELPGISEEKIRIDLENHSTSITIIASNAGIQYKKVITIPCDVRFHKKRFFDGVLKLTMEKISSDSL